MSYNLRYSSDAVREIDDLDKSIKLQILKKLAQLKANPDLGKPLSNILKNKYSLHVGRYRVVYTVECGKDIVVMRVAHRKEAYY